MLLCRSHRESLNLGKWPYLAWMNVMQHQLFRKVSVTIKREVQVLLECQYLCLKDCATVDKWWCVGQQRHTKGQFASLRQRRVLIFCHMYGCQCTCRKKKGHKMHHTKKLNTGELYLKIFFKWTADANLKKSFSWIT